MIKNLKYSRTTDFKNEFYNNYFMPQDKQRLKGPLCIRRNRISQENIKYIKENLNKSPAEIKRYLENVSLQSIRNYQIEAGKKVKRRTRKGETKESREDKINLFFYNIVDDLLAKDPRSPKLYEISEKFQLKHKTLYKLIEKGLFLNKYKIPNWTGYITYKWLSVLFNEENEEIKESLFLNNNHVTLDSLTNLFIKYFPEKEKIREGLENITNEWNEAEIQRHKRDLETRKFEFENSSKTDYTTRFILNYFKKHQKTKINNSYQSQ